MVNEIFEESCKVFNWNITAGRFWKEREVHDGAVSIEKQIDPELDTLHVEIELSGIVFHVHQHIAPSSECEVDIIIIYRHEKSRMLFCQYHVLVFIFANQKDVRYLVARYCGLANGGIQQESECYEQ